MKNIKSKSMAALLVISAICVSMTGCFAPNTTTHLKMNPATGEMSWSNPKDTSIQSFESGINTNGTKYIKVTGFSTLNNPQVITAVGTAEANSITATGAAATQVLNAVAAVGGTAAAAAATSGLK